jgi:sugar (glycoside-pentoside-hexuronide) transporter
MSETPQLTWTARLGWAFGQSAIASHMAIISVYLLFFLTEAHHVPAALAGAVLLIPRIWNVVTDPLVGAISDRTRSRWGRRRPYLLFGSLLWGAAFIAMFCMPRLDSPTAAAMLFCVMFLFVNTGVSLYHVPYSAMAPEMVSDYRGRLSLVGYKEMAARIAVLAAISIAPLLIAAAPDQLAGYRYVGIAFGGLIVLSGLVAFVTTANAPCVAFEPQAMTLRDQLQTLRQNRPLAQLSIAYLIANIADAAFAGMLIYFVTVVAKQSPAVMGVLYPLGAVTSVFMTPVWAKLGARFGKREACIAAYVGLGLCWLALLVLPAGQWWWLYPMMIVFGFFNAGEQLLPNAMVPDTVEYDEMISGARREGTIYGAWVFVQQTGMAFGSFLVGVLLSTIGFAGVESADEGVALGVRYTIAVLPALCVFVGVLIIRRYPLSVAEFARIQTILAERRAPLREERDARAV